jgi:hypothetical protein
MAPTCPVNSLQGKSDVNVKTCSQTVTVKMVAAWVITFKLKDLGKGIWHINPLYIQKSLYRGWFIKIFNIIFIIVLTESFTKCWTILQSDTSLFLVNFIPC